MESDKSVLYYAKGYRSEKIIELLPCPFCGGEPDFRHIGNEYTKRRSIEVKCKTCRVTRTDAALTHSLSWLEDVAAKNWNQRPLPTNKQLGG